MGMKGPSIFWGTRRFGRREPAPDVLRLRETVSLKYGRKAEELCRAIRTFALTTGPKRGM